MQADRLCLNADRPSLSPFSKPLLSLKFTINKINSCSWTP